jgi:hypothetical protein
MFDSLRPRRTFYVVEWRLATHEGVRRDHDWRSLSATSARFPLLGLPTRWKGTGFEAFDPETGECLIRRNFTALEDFHAPNGSLSGGRTCLATLAHLQEITACYGLAKVEAWRRLLATSWGAEGMRLSC